MSRREKHTVKDSMPPTAPPAAAHPFLKWAGGKRGIVKELLSALPKFNRYFEPFLGGAALFFKILPANATISDGNAKLMTTYAALQRNPDAVISRLRTYVNTKRSFLKASEKNFCVGSGAERAADFIFCNRVTYNGLYRENLRGQYNVAYNHKSQRATICNEENLRAVAGALQGIELRAGDFEEAVADAEPGDFCYFDPPYVPVTATSKFTSYRAGAFGHQCHRRSPRVPFSSPSPGTRCQSTDVQDCALLASD